MRKLTLLLLCCLIAHNMARGQTSTYEYRYWFDENASKVYTGSYNETFDIDVSSLTEGTHILHFLVSKSDTLSATFSRMFVKTAMANESRQKTLLFIDGALHSEKEQTMSGGVMTWEANISDVSPGIHTWMVVSVSPHGVATNEHNGIFIRTDTDDELTDAVCHYSVDGRMVAKTSGSQSGSYSTFDLDVASLSDGIHELSYWLSFSNGSCSTPRNAYFIKIPLGGTGITEYEYWLNEDFDARRHVTLDKRTDPLQLVEILDIDVQPLRPVSYTFEVVDGVPMVSACDDLHIRFIDAGGRMTEYTTIYTNTESTAKILQLLTLMANEPRTVDCPEADKICWFELSAPAKESISMKASRNCTLQLYDPDGTLLYTAQGSDATSFGGCMTTVNGTYYLALHSINGTASANSKTTDTEVSSSDNPRLIAGNKTAADQVTVEFRMGSRLKGDVDRNYTIDITDVMLIVDYVLGKPSDKFNFRNADITGNNEVDVTDAMTIVDIILGKNSNN